MGLEIFFNAFVKLSKNQQKAFTLHCDKQTISETEKITGHHLSNLNIRDIQPIPTLSTASLLSAMDSCSERDILLTLPTSKEQLHYNNEKPAGHTEFFRKKFNRPMQMMFKSNKESILLVTDHVPLRLVPNLVTKERVEEVIENTLSKASLFFNSFENVLISGLNPHAGEGGILGDEEKEIEKAIENLKVKFPRHQFFGPLPADTLHFHEFARLKSSLMVYMYHDQGLSYFKGVHGKVGANITLGMDYLRLSVDHGTAFDLYGKNHADSDGCQFVMELALSVEASHGNGIYKRD